MERQFRFNKIYVLESLKPNETQTGTELYNDLLKWKELQLEQLSAERIIINSKLVFFKELTRIKNECINTGVYPIMHIEIHGSVEKDGLVLNSGELVKWEELYSDLITINKVVGNNLFLTMAVCFGAHLMQLIKLDKPSPYWGIIGSFDEIYPEDLMIRYNNFYDEFLTSFNLDKAINRLRNSNPNIPEDYRYINSEETFEQVYNNYLSSEFSKAAIKKRAHDSIVDENLPIYGRKEKRKFERKFEKELLITKSQYFKQDFDTFFMIEDFPENKNRFKVNVKP